MSRRRRTKGEKKAKATGEHCWDPVLDAGSTVPVSIPIDSRSEARPFRVVTTTRKEQMIVHFKCCRCAERGVRRFEPVRCRDGHGPYHEAFDMVEVETLPRGPCSGRP